MTLNLNYLQTLRALLFKSLIIFKPKIKDQLINGIIWTTLSVAVFAYIFPEMGLKGMGSFILVSSPISWAFFAATNNIGAMIMDITEDGGKLSYELTLPIPQELTLSMYAIENAYQGFLTSILILPIGTLTLFNQFSFEHFSFFKFHLMLFIASLFFGFFSLLMASITENIHKIENIWLRFIFPLWYLGGYQFSWQTLCSLSPYIGYLNLLNPLNYAMEGSRAAALDPSTSIPYWYCIGALLIFTVIVGYAGIYKLKKRLDCI